MKIKKKYMDLETDAIDPNGISKGEVDTLTQKEWVVKEIPKDTVLEVCFKNPAGQEYTKKGIVPAGTTILINPDTKEALVTVCRNDIKSDWRTLIKLLK